MKEQMNINSVMVSMRSFLGIALCFTAGLSSLAQCEADHVVYASNYSYEPQVLQIGQGESVAFINNQGFHDVNGDINTLTGSSYNNPESFYLSPIVGNAAGACIGVVTFNEVGEYNYDCSIGSHAQLGMVASIQVQASVTSGCTYDFACNFNPSAEVDDGSCEVSSCVLSGDLDNDGAVTTSDLIAFLAVFGQVL